MGIIDKAKSFLGGHGVTIRHLTIEDRDPSAAHLALPDGGLKARFAVVTDKPCTVLGRKSEVVMQIAHAEGRVEEVVLGRDEAPLPDVERASAVKYPYELAAGFEVIDELDIVFDGSIEALLALRSLTVGSGLRFFLRTLVDVQGSPFDPEAVDELPLHTEEAPSA
jgi:hypothetical protein